MDALDDEQSTMSDVMVAALDIAASGHASTDRPIDTHGLLVALVRADHDARWNRIEREFPSPDRADECDPEPDEGGWWRGVPLSRTCTTAVRTALCLARHYDMLPCPPGALAACLVAAPGSAAALTRTHGDEDRRFALLDTIQLDLIGHRLPGIRSVLRSCSDAADPDVLDLLVAILHESTDRDLARRMRRLLLDAPSLSQVRARVADLPSVRSTAVAAKAAATFGRGDPSPAQLVFVATSDPSEATRRALWYLGLSAAEVAVEARLAMTNGEFERPWFGYVAPFLLLSSLTAATTNTWLLVRAAVDSHAWGIIALVPLAWIGHPATSPLVSAAVAATLWSLVGTVSGLIAVAGSAFDAFRSMVQYRMIRQVTGVRLSWAEWRRFWIRQRGAGPLAATLGLKAPTLVLQRLRLIRLRHRRLGIGA